MLQVSSKCGLSLDVLTDILESCHWPTILSLNEEFENVSSKPAKWFLQSVDLLLVLWQRSQRVEAEEQIWHWLTISLHIEHSKNMSSNSAKWFLQSMDFL